MVELTKETAVEAARLAGVLRNAISRCHNPDNKQWADYGGRGIYVDDVWLDDLGAFILWSIEHGSNKSLQLDRTDNDGPYKPENCRYVTPKVNHRNRRTSIIVTAFGETKHLTEWLEDPRFTANVDRKTVYRRVQQGYSGEMALTAARLRKRPEYCKKKHLLSPDNLYMRKDTGATYCKQCTKDRAREYKKRKQLSFVPP